MINNSEKPCNQNVIKLITILLVLALFASFVGCTQPKQTKNNLDTTITVIDQAGRTVTLEHEAERIVSPYYISSYAIIALGLSNKLVGIEKKADSRPIYKLAAPEFIDLPVVGSLKEINIEQIASLSPDLVILPKKLSEQSDAIELLGIKTIIVNPETQDGLFEMLRLIGTCTGTLQRANELIAYTETKINQLNFTESIPSTLFLGNSSYLTCAPSGMYQSDLIRLSGGTNAFTGNNDTYWTSISYETLLALDPDYIIIPSGASYSVEDFTNDETISSLKAIQNGNVYCVPNTFEEWDSPIPSCVLGVLWLSNILHPSEYTTEDFESDITELYETFYGFTPTKEMLESVH